MYEKEDKDSPENLKKTLEESFYIELESQISNTFLKQVPRETEVTLPNSKLRSLFDHNYDPGMNRYY